MSDWRRRRRIKVGIDLCGDIDHISAASKIFSSPSIRNKWEVINHSAEKFRLPFGSRLIFGWKTLLFFSPPLLAQLRGKLSRASSSLRYPIRFILRIFNCSLALADARLVDYVSICHLSCWEIVFFSLHPMESDRTSESSSIKSNHPQSHSLVFR